MMMRFRSIANLNINLIKYCNVSLTSKFTYKIRLNHTLSETSWVAEVLVKKGEKLSSTSSDAAIIADDDYINTPSEKVKQLAYQILMLNTVEINQLLKLKNDRLGISDEMLFMQAGLNPSKSDFSHLGKGLSSSSGDAGIAQTAAVEAAPAVEKTSFDLKLTAVDAKSKIKIIKEVRSITGLGLKEAKDLVEKAPVIVKQGLKKDEVENFKKLLLDAGAQVEIL